MAQVVVLFDAVGVLVGYFGDGIAVSVLAARKRRVWTVEGAET